MDLGAEPPSIKLCLGTSPGAGGGAMLHKINISDNEAHVRLLPSDVSMLGWCCTVISSLIRPGNELWACTWV